MNSEAKIDTVNTNQELLDKLISYKLNAETVANSEVAIKAICEAVDSLEKKLFGYTLLSITNNKTSRLHLITKVEKKWQAYTVYSWNIDEKIEKPLDAKIHEISNDNIEEQLRELSVKYNNDFTNIYIDRDSLVNYLITDSLTGYVVSLKKVTDHLDFLASNQITKVIDLNTIKTDSLPYELMEIGNFVNDTIDKKQRDVREIITTFSENLQCDKLSLVVSNMCFSREKEIAVGKITKVTTNNLTRTYQVTIFSKDTEKKLNKAYITTIVSSAKAGTTGSSIKLNTIGPMWMGETRPGYSEEARIDNFTRIPYNFIDEGRIVLSVPRMGPSYDIFVCPDPRVDANHLETSKTVLVKYIDALTKNLARLSGTSISDGSMRLDFNSFESTISKDSADVKPLNIRLKALKKMVDEYQ